MNFFKSLLSNDGQISSMRFSLLTGVFLVCLLTFTILYIVIFEKNIEYIDKITYAIGVIAGIFIVGKSIQKISEARETYSKTVESSTENNVLIENQNRN